MSPTLNILPIAVITRSALFHLRPVKGRSGAWRWMKKILLGLIDGNGEQCLSGHVNSFALMKMSNQSQATWTKNVGSYRMVKRSI